MSSNTTKSSYSFYTDDELMAKVERLDDYSRSEAITEALESWIDAVENNT